jgi:hypothetical protein
MAAWLRMSRALLDRFACLACADRSHRHHVGGKGGEDLPAALLCFLLTAGGADLGQGAGC